MYFKNRHKTHHQHKNGKIFAWLALTTGLGNAAFWTIFPLVANDTIKSEALIGLFFTLISLMCLLGSLFSTYFFRKVSRVTIMKTSLIGGIIFLLLFTLVSSFLEISFVEIPRSIFTLFVGIALSLYIRDFAKQKNIGMAEGRYYLYANIGWLIGPLIGGMLGEYVSRNSVFIFSSVLYLISLIIFYHQHIKGHPVIYHTVEKSTFKDIIFNFKDFFKTKELWKVFVIALGMNYWWVISSIFIPIYIISKNYSEITVGIVIAGGMLPLVILEKFIGSLSDKHGVRIYITIGFFIIALITTLFNVVSYIPMVFFLMAFVNVGAALIEPLQETYLFKHIKKKDEERFFGIYNTSDPLANVIAPLIASIFLIIGGLKGLWYGSSIIMLFFMFMGLSIKNVKSKK